MSDQRNQPAEFKFNPMPGGAPHADPEGLPLYAMQLLPADQAAALGQHLEQCSDCRRELAEVQGDLAAYAHSVDLESPPDSARQRLLSQVAREKKVVPIAPPALAAYGRGASIYNPSYKPSYAPMPGSTPGPILGSIVDDDRPRRSASPAILGWSGWAIAAGLAVAAIFLYQDRDSLRTTIANQSGEIASLSAAAGEARQLREALTDPKAVRVTLTEKPTPHAPIGRATYNSDKGALVFLASDLDPLQSYKTYELWLIPADDGPPVPAGTFHPDGQGNASLILPGLPKGVPAKGFGVTIENEGGSQTPTKPIVMAGN